MRICSGIEERWIRGVSRDCDKDSYELELSIFERRLIFWILFLFLFKCVLFKLPAMNFYKPF